MSKKNKKSTVKSNPLKVILPVVCGLVLVAVVALVISLATAPAKSAHVSNPKEAVVQIGDYKVTKQELYEAMKSGSGLTVLQEVVDKELLKDVVVSDNEAAEIKNYLFYGDESQYEDMTEEEASKAKEESRHEYELSLKMMGYLTETEINNYIDLQVKRYKYALDKFLEAKASASYTDEEIQAAFKADDRAYEDQVKAIVITFANSDQLAAYLKLVDIDPDSYTKGWKHLSMVEANRAIDEEIGELQAQSAMLEEQIIDKQAELEATEDPDLKTSLQGEIDDLVLQKEAIPAQIEEKENSKADEATFALTDAEIAFAFVKLYNLLYAYYQGDGNFDEAGNLLEAKELLKEDEHYSVAPDSLTFNLENLAALEEANEFVKFSYTKAEAKKQDGSTSDTGKLDKVLFETLFFAYEVSEEELKGENAKIPTTYTKSAETMTNGLTYLAYKLEATKGAEIDEAALASQKAAIVTKLNKEAFNDDYETKYLIELRQANGLKLYDRYLNASYKAAYDYLYDTTLKEENHAEYASDGKKSKKLAFSFTAGGKTIEKTADEFYELLVKQYGAQSLSTKMTAYALLTSEEYNIIYDPYHNKIRDKESYQNVVNGFNIYNLYYYGQLTTVKEFKYAFENDVFETYGFPKAYGWKNFLNEYMLLKNDRFLVGSLVQSQANTYFNLSKITQEQLNAEMKESYDKYYSMDVINTLITVDYNNDGQPDVVELDAEKAQEYWTDTQIALAQELTDKLYEYRDENNSDENTTLEAKLKAACELYSKATVADENWGKYQQAGLKAKVESTASYTSSSSLVEEFHVEMEKIYKGLAEYKEDKEAGIYLGENVFPTVYGYHRVAVTNATERTIVIEDFSQLDIALYKKYLSTPDQIDETLTKKITGYLEPAVEALANDDQSALWKVELRQQLLSKVTFNNDTIKANLNTYEQLVKEHLEEHLNEEE